MKRRQISQAAQGEGVHRRRGVRAKIVRPDDSSGKRASTWKVVFFLRQKKKSNRSVGGEFREKVFDPPSAKAGKGKLSKKGAKIYIGRTGK